MPETKLLTLGEMHLPIKQKGNSVGVAMARMLGLPNPNDSLRRREEMYERLRKNVISFQRGIEFNNERFEVFRDDLKELFKEVIKAADVLVITITQALDSFYFENFDADVLVIDEATLVNDAQLLALQGSYSNVDKLFLAGDREQLGVFNKNRQRNQGRNPVLEQWTYSIQARLADAGY